MKTINKKKVPVLAFTIMSVIALGTVSAFGAIKYLTPSGIALELGDTTLADAFKSKNAIAINQNKVVGNTKYNLMGMISGKSLSKYVEKSNRDEIKDNKTYIVTSIENTDGSKRPTTSDKNYVGADMIVTPLVKGINPSVLNIYTMGGGYSEIIEDGIQYRLVESDNIEMFADKGIYLAICDSNNFNTIYNYNETTGAITPNKDYNGLNIIFDLPIDKSKANTNKAEKYLADLTSNNNKEDNTSEADTELDKLIKELSTMSTDKLLKKCTKLDNLTQTLTPDKDGYIKYTYTIPETGQSSEAKVLASELLINKKTNEPALNNIAGSDVDNLYIEMLYKNQDGTITLQVYKYNK